MWRRMPPMRLLLAPDGGLMQLAVVEGEPAGERGVTWEADAAGRREDVHWR